MKHNVQKNKIISNKKEDFEKKGLLRISIGCYTNYDDIDRLIYELIRIIKGNFIGKYIYDQQTKNYIPEEYDPRILGRFFTI